MGPEDHWWNWAASVQSAPEFDLTLDLDEFATAIDAAATETVLTLLMTGCVPEFARQRLATHPDPAVRGWVAATTRDPDLYGKLADDSAPQVRAQAVVSRFTTAEGLALFAKDRRVEVRCSVAAHIGTPHDVLMSLCRDRSSRVRAQLTSGPHMADRQILQALLTDSDELTAMQARGLLDDLSSIPPIKVLSPFDQITTALATLRRSSPAVHD